MSVDPTILRACDLAIKTSALLIATRLGLAAWRTVSANQRHTAWLVAFTTLLILPASLLFQPRWQLAKNASAPGPESTFLPERTVLGGSAILEPVHAIPSAPRMQMPGYSEGLKALWLAGFACVLGYRFLGSLRLFALRRQSFNGDHRVSRFCEQMRGSLGIRRRVDVRISAGCKVPMTWGTVAPVVLLPPEALEWSDAVLLAALRHEGAHIARKDHFSAWLTQIACAIYWPNPLVWSAYRSLRLAQEQSADDSVLRMGTPAENYADQLLKTAINMKNTPSSVCNALGMATPSTLESRLLSILDSRRSRAFSGWATRLATLGLAAITLFASASAQLKAESKQPIPEPPGKSEPESAAAAKARKIIIPKMHFVEATLDEGLEFLRIKSRDLDPEKTGVNLVLCTTPSSGAPKRLSLALTDIPVYNGLKAIADLEGYEVKESQDALILAAPDWKSFTAKIPGEDNPLFGKARTIILPKVELEGASASEVASYLSMVSKSFDPDKKGINIILKPSALPPPLITLSLRNVPVTSVLSLVAQSIGYGLKFDGAIFYFEPSK